MPGPDRSAPRTDASRFPPSTTRARRGWFATARTATVDPCPSTSSDIRVLHLEAEGDPISTPDDASDLVGAAWSHQANLVAVPVERLDPEFFRLSTGIAGEITQKLVNYRLRLAVDRRHLRTRSPRATPCATSCGSRTAATRSGSSPTRRRSTRSWRSAPPAAPDRRFDGVPRRTIGLAAECRWLLRHSQYGESRSCGRRASWRVGDILVSTSGSVYEVTKLARIGRGIRVTYLDRRRPARPVHRRARGGQPGAHARRRVSSSPDRRRLTASITLVGESASPRAGSRPSA